MAKKFVASDHRATEIQIEGARTGSTQSYRANKQGVFEVESSQHAKAFKNSDMVEVSLMGATVNPRLGYNCLGCGFGSWFKKCSRCGTENGV